MSTYYTVKTELKQVTAFIGLTVSGLKPSGTNHLQLYFKFNHLLHKKQVYKSHNILIWVTSL